MKKEKMKLNISEVLEKTLDWLQIAISPTLAGLMISVFIFKYQPNESGIIIGMFISLIGFLIGAIWATWALISNDEL